MLVHSKKVNKICPEGVKSTKESKTVKGKCAVPYTWVDKRNGIRIKECFRSSHDTLITNQLKFC